MWKEVTQEAWDKILATFHGTTFFDTAKWQELFSWKVQHIIYLHFSIKNTIVAGISFGVGYKDNTYFLKSPFTAPFGGILTKKDLPISNWLYAIEELKNFLYTLCRGHINILYIQRGRIIAPSDTYDAQEFALKYHAFQEKDLLYELAINTQQPKYLTSRAQTTLNSIIKQHILHFQKATLDDFLTFRQYVVQQQGKTITVPDKELYAGHRLFPEAINFWKVTKNSTPIAILLSDTVNDHVCIGRNWFMDMNYTKDNVTLYLLYSWLQHVKCLGIPYASFGGTLQTSQKSTNNTLQFKERFIPAISYLRKTFIYKDTYEE